MAKHQMRLLVLALLAFAFLTEPSHALTGHVRVVFAKAGLIAGAGVGRPGGSYLPRSRLSIQGFGAKPGLYRWSLR
jgi:hypothetical protein